MLVSFLFRSVGRENRQESMVCNQCQKWVDCSCNGMHSVNNFMRLPYNFVRTLNNSVRSLNNSVKSADNVAK